MEGLEGDIGAKKREQFGLKWINGSEYEGMNK